ncbi:MAG: carboxy terminal-processing peptidase [Fluviicola sp.]|nr:carboxy terminal-processing peptidase [Fluviicola sp.]
MRFYLLLCGFLFHSIVGLAIDESRVINQADILVKRIQKEHVKPRAINDDFGKSVHRLVMQFLDPQHRFFTAEDMQEFERLSASIDQDIEEKKLTYFSVVAKRFETRLSELTTLTQTFLTNPVNLKSTIRVPYSMFDHPALGSKHHERWKQELQLEVMDRMLGLLTDDQDQFPSDSIAVWEKKVRTEITDYYQTTTTELTKNQHVLEDAYLEAIAMAFDPHSLYFSPTQKSEFEEELTPDRELFGFSFGESESEKVIVTDVFPGSPAWLSDELHEGDILKGIQLGKAKMLDLTDPKNDAAAVRDYFDTHDEDEIKLIILDEAGKEREVNLTKARVYSDGDIIKNAVLHGEQKIGYVTLPDFYVNWTDTSALGCSNDLAKCILKLNKENIQGLILDLRGNGGGSLHEAVDLSGLFIDYGPVVAIKDNTGEVEVLKDFNRGSVYNGPLIVMIDEGSASASEIVAGALQDYNKALIVGQRSFGKATSQRIYPLDPNYNELTAFLMEENSDFGYANITGGVLYRVTRNWNQKNGVVPDITLPFRLETGESIREETYENALIPDSITKKMTFTPNAALPVNQLKTASENRVQTSEPLKNYVALLSEYQAMFEKDTILSFDLAAQLKQRNAWQLLTKKLEDFQDSLSVGFEPKANLFDAEIYQANDLMRQYNDKFLERLNTDIELMETVNIMNDLIKSKK